MLGFDSRSSLNKKLRRASLSTSRSMVYAVGWDDEVEQIAQSISTIHLDVGTL